MAHSRPFGRTAWDKAAGKVTDAPARVPQILRIWIAEGLSCVFVHRNDLNKFGHLPTAFIELFSTVLVERHGGGAPSEGLQPKVLIFELIPFETGCPIMDHSRPFGRAAWDLPSTQI